MNVEGAPDGRGGGVAVAEEGVLGGVHVLSAELELLLDLLNDGAATGVYADVVKSHAEVGNVGLHLHLEHLAAHKIEEKDELLRKRQNQRSQGGDVLFEGTACLSH